MTTTIEIELRRRDKNTIEWFAKASSDLARVRLGVSLRGTMITKQWGNHVVTREGSVTHNGECRYWAIADGVTSPEKNETAMIVDELGADENHASAKRTVPDQQFQEETESRNLVRP